MENLRSLFGSRKFAEAITVLDGLFARGKDSVRLRGLRASAAAASEDWPTARDQAKAGALLDPQNLEVLGLLKQAAEKLEDKDLVFETSKALAEIQEDNAELLLDVVRQASARGDVPAVLEYVERALEVAPFAPEVQEALALARTAGMSP